VGNPSKVLGSVVHMSGELVTYTKETDFKKDRYVQFIMAGDVGATNTRLRVSAVEANHTETIYDVKYDSGSPDKFMDGITRAILIARNKYGIPNIEKAAIGVAGRISRDRQICTITFLDWGQDAPIVNMIKELGIRQVYLMNDLEAATYGIRLASKENLVRISAEETSLPQKENYELILGMPGTGFGDGYRDKYGMSKPTEGGGRIVAIAPGDKMEHDLLLYIHEEINKKRSKGEEQRLPTYDYVVSGPGIKRIKDVLLRQERYVNYSPEIINRINSVPENEQPEIISSLALGKDELCSEGREDEFCLEVMEIFCKFFARSMQGIALLTLPEAVFLAGHIVSKNLTIIKRAFMKHFTNHANHEGYLQRLPVYIIDNEEDLNMKGATYAAMHLAG